MSKISTRIFYKKNCITLRLDKPYKILDQKKKKKKKETVSTCSIIESMKKRY